VIAAVSGIWTISRPITVNPDTAAAAEPKQDAGHVALWLVHVDIRHIPVLVASVPVVESALHVTSQLSLNWVPAASITPGRSIDDCGSSKKCNCGVHIQSVGLL